MPIPSATTHPPELLQSLAEKVGTPFWLLDAGVLRQRIADVQSVTAGEGVQARFAMKSCPATRVLKEMLAHDIWVDTVSGNEVLRALHAGFSPGHTPPTVFLTTDVFRDNALEVVNQHGILPNLGSPGMLQDLKKSGYTGPIALRLNPGFGHGHVNECDTGGPSSKHGIWFENVQPVVEEARRLGFPIAMLHSHIGSGPRFEELLENLAHLAEEFANLLPQFPDVTAISLGGGLPFDYKNQNTTHDLGKLRALLDSTRRKFCEIAGRDIRLEIEPGRYFAAPMGTLVARVHDIKRTETNTKGAGETFVMVDAGFVDLVRPAMYGSYHRIEVVGKDAEAATGKVVVAGPLCESGDVFTRDGSDMLAPRNLPVPEIGDLITIHDGGAYGYAMSSNYNSVGRAPQLWLEKDGSIEMISRRETLADLLGSEVNQPL